MHQHGGRDAVDEIAVVADQQQRALIVRQQFLQQVERFEIEVVGRFVEDEEIRRLGQFARQDQPPRSPPDSTETGVRACSGGTGSPACRSSHAWSRH
jgi:hypothetical protein